MKKTHAASIFLILVAIPVVVWQLGLKDDSKITNRAQAVACIESFGDMLNRDNPDPAVKMEHFLMEMFRVCGKVTKQKECNWAPEARDSIHLANCRASICKRLFADEAGCPKNQWSYKKEVEFAAASVHSAIGIAPSETAISEVVSSINSFALLQTAQKDLGADSKHTDGFSDNQIADTLLLPFGLLLSAAVPHEIKTDDIQLPKKNKTSRRSIPRIAVNIRPGAVILTVNFSSYCSPKPKLTYRVEERSIHVTPFINPDVPVSRCVEGYRSAINVDGLKAGPYTVVWEGAGTLEPFSIEIP